MQPKKLALLISEINIGLRTQPTLQYLESFQSKGDLDENKKSEFRKNIFASYDGYVKATQHPEKSQLIHHLKINEIYASEKISKIVGVVEGAGKANIVLQPEYASLFQSFISSLRILLNYSNTFQHYIVATRYPQPEETEDILDLDIVDVDENYVGIDQLISVLKAIQSLYDTIARTLKKTPNDSKVVFIESGTSIKISIKGLSEIIKEVKATIIQVWHQIRFKDIDLFDRKLESAQKAVDLIAYINDKKNKNEIEAQEASIAIESIWKNTFEIIKNGALPSEEFQSNEELNTEKLLAQKSETKQIEAPKPKNKKEDEDNARAQTKD